MSQPSSSGWVNPIGAGAQPARVDMGVDYTGAYNLYAMGAGTITNLYNSGWPGGTFIGLKLDTGQYMYYAENIAVEAGLKIGQRVTAGQKLGTARNAYPYTEIGWASPPGTGETMAAATGEQLAGQSQKGDPGAFSTAYGVSMSNTIASLGGPAGILTPGGIQGTVSGNYPAGATLDASGQPTGDTTSAAGCAPLIWMVYCALVKAQESRWLISRRERRNRRSPHEARNRSGCRRAIAHLAWRRTRVDANRAQTG